MAVTKRHMLWVKMHYGVPKQRSACSTMVFTRMVSDPAQVTCQRCRESNIFARVSNAA